MGGVVQSICPELRSCLLQSAGSASIEKARATVTYSAASQSSDPVENEFFKPLERRAAELELSQQGSYDQSPA